jgi:hypothetical protein
VLTHLLGQPRVQLKAREASGPGDALEQEADHAAESVVPGGTAAASPPPPASAPAGSAAAAALIVEDDAEHIESAQMRKTEFLAEMRTAVCATADEGLQASGQTAQGCPWIEYWLSYYGGQDAAHLERALHKFAPVAAGVTSARDYIPIAAARVRQSVDRYAKTGEAPDMPEGMPGGGLLAGAASIFFKAREGGARVADPQSVRQHLGSGQPLESGVRSRMESAFGAGFSHVRVHTGGTAAALSDQMNARAFAVGNHVAFSPGEYDPHSLVGQALIAHELAHVVQQRDARESTSVDQSSRAGAPHSALEEDADHTAVNAVVSILGGTGRGQANIGRQVMPRLKAGLKLQRCGRHDPVPSATPDIANTQQALGEHAAQVMTEANNQTKKTKTTGIYYANEYKTRYPDAYDDDWGAGYADPDYWERIDSMHWRLKKGRSASAGVKAWLKGLTIAECYSTAMVIEVDSVRAAIGDAKFDELYGSEDKPVEPRLEMGMNGATPLGHGTLAFIQPDPATLGGIGHRPAKVGDWCYFYNHPRYLLKHPAWEFQGENALLREDPPAPAVQIWEGLGESHRTERDMYQDMLESYNSPRDERDLSTLESIKQVSGGTLPLDYYQYPETLSTWNDILAAPGYKWKDPWGKFSDTTERKGGFAPSFKRLDVARVQDLKDKK